MSSRDRSDGHDQLMRPPRRRTLLRRFTAWVERAHALRRWVEALRKRSAAVDASFEAIERDSDIGGAMLAGALSYRLFVFALPLAVFVISGVGLLASALDREPASIGNSIGLAGMVTKQVAGASKGSSNWWVALSSLVVLVYAARVLLRAVAIVHALAWERSASSVKVRARSLAVFGVVLATQLGLVAAVGAVTNRRAVGEIVAVGAFVFALGGLWLILSLHLPHGTARWAQLIPGSLFYALGIVCVVLFNALILDRLLQEKSSTYGALGIAAALLLGFFFAGRVIVGAAVVNVTLHERRQDASGPGSG
jgi:uncharacterized BrkB/YihY/UPF0761 family membrane protein